MGQSSVVAVDLAKNVFQVAMGSGSGPKVVSHRLRRKDVLSWFANRPASTVVMEACGSSHHWARQLAALGHQPVLLPAHHVRPYVRGNKTDHTDAVGLLEAYRHAAIRPVPVKSLDQQALGTLHRLRTTWQETRTARLNALRGLLREFGVTIPVGPRHVLVQVRQVLAEPEGPVPASLHEVLRRMVEEVEQLELRVEEVESRLVAQSRERPEVRRLRTIPGIGLLGSTALVAFVGTPHRFAQGRQLSCYLGLTAREDSSGERRRLGKISKRGDTYLRTLLIHGARAVLRSAARKQHPDRLHRWALEVQQRRGPNKATVAVANKLARLAWAVWRRQKDYQAQEATPG